MPRRQEYWLHEARRINPRRNFPQYPPGMDHGGTATVQVQQGVFLALSHKWPTPVAIICDGPYGLNSYPGDLRSHRQLPDWYRPHLERFTEAATPEATLWFWNTEIGWATVHPLLESLGWIYHAANIWNKGLSHVAGNSNTKTLRRFPVVTAFCVQYVRKEVVHLVSDGRTMQDWLRAEWRRAGLPLHAANHACGVKSAASRKYLADDDKWYLPPPAMLNAVACLNTERQYYGAEIRPEYWQAGEQRLEKLRQRLL